jgi:hypothetical protein
VRWRRHEDHVLTEVVVATAAVGTPTAGNAGFEGDAVADGDVGDVLPRRDDLTGALVAEDERIVDHVVANSTVFVVVDVGPTDPHVTNTYQNFVTFWRGLFPIFEVERLGVGEYGSAHRG